MIVCKVCSSENDEFSIKCFSCGSFIQDRIPNLDLFSMVGNIIENPTIAIKRVIIAEHKNYVLFLSLFLGIATVFFLFWLRNFGNAFDNVLPLIVLGFFSGVALSIPLFFVMTYSLYSIIRILGGKGSFKNTYAVFGWSLVPIMLSVIFVFPVELATLGLIFFSQNPTPFEVKPEVYSILIGLNAVSVLWTLFIAAKGMAIVHKKSFLLTLPITALVFCSIGIGVDKIFSLFIN